MGGHMTPQIYVLTAGHGAPGCSLAAAGVVAVATSWVLHQRQGVGLQPSRTQCLVAAGAAMAAAAVWSCAPSLQWWCSIVRPPSPLTHCLWLVLRQNKGRSFGSASQMKSKEHCVTKQAPQKRLKILGKMMGVWGVRFPCTLVHFVTICIYMQRSKYCSANLRSEANEEPSDCAELLATSPFFS